MAAGTTRELRTQKTKSQNGEVLAVGRPRMKLPVDFGTKIFFRILSPGIITAALLAHLTYASLQVLGMQEYWGYVFTVQSIALGCVFSALDMPIYMLFEGRRYMPGWVRTSLTEMEQYRLDDLLIQAKDPRLPWYIPVGSRHHRIESARVKLEAQLEVSHFPINEETNEREVQCPTRLGNLVYAFEQYSEIKYGLDVVFYWPRIWLAMDKDSREEIDSHQALADGLLYTVFGAVFASVLWICSAFLVPWNPEFELFHYPWLANLLIGFAILAGSYMLYRASLFVHASFGSLFCAAVDIHRSKVHDAEAEALVASMAGAEQFSKLDQKRRNEIVWRYLRWHRVDRLGE